MTIHFRPAVREAVKLMIGIAGPSGSGKTFSALRIAKGLAGDGSIFGIDTEGRRMLHYADQFTFQHADLTAPFSPERYEEALAEATKAGATVIIVDSMSHAHEGPGGLLEMHDAELQRMAGDDGAKRERVKFAAWIKPKAAHNRFLNAVLQMSVHLIFCFRAKDKLVLVRNAQGKQEPVSAGIQPICSDRFEYEMTTMLVLPPGARGVPDLRAQACKLQEQHRSAIPEGQQLSEETGAALARWAKGETPKPNGTDWAAWGSKVVVWVANSATKRQLDAFPKSKAADLEGYRAWNAEKWEQLMQLVAQRKTELTNQEST